MSKSVSYNVRKYADSQPVGQCGFFFPKKITTTESKWLQNFQGHQNEGPEREDQERNS